MDNYSKLDSDIINTLLIEAMDGENQALSGNEIHVRLSNPPRYLTTTNMRITHIKSVERDKDELAPRFRLRGTKSLDMEILMPRQRRKAA